MRCYVTYYIQSHHRHQYILDSHHNDQKMGCIVHCCTGMLHCCNWLKWSSQANQREKRFLIFTCHLVLQAYAIAIITMAHPNRYLLHPVSSLPSVQSWVPSQRSEDRMHCPLLHRNAPLWQEAVEIAKILCINNWWLRMLIHNAKFKVHVAITQLI